MYWALWLMAYVVPIPLVGFCVYLFFRKDSDSHESWEGSVDRDRVRLFLMVFAVFTNWMSYGFFCDYLNGTAIGTVPDSGSYVVASSNSAAPVSESAWVLSLIWGGLTWLSLPLVVGVLLVREYAQGRRVLVLIMGATVIVIWTLIVIARIGRSLAAYGGY